MTDGLQGIVGGPFFSPGSCARSSDCYTRMAGVEALEGRERLTDESGLPYVQKTVGNIFLQDFIFQMRSKYSIYNNLVIYNR